MPVVVAATDVKAREGAAWFVSFYVTTMGTLYRDSLTRQGYGKAVEAVLTANAPKFTGVVPADAEELLEQLTVYGTPPEARRRLARWHEAGAAFPALPPTEPRAGGARAGRSRPSAHAPVCLGVRLAACLPSPRIRRRRSSQPNAGGRIERGRRAKASLLPRSG